MSKFSGSIWGKKPKTTIKENTESNITFNDSIIHTLIDSEGNSYNISLRIENNKLIAIWDGEKSIIDLEKCNIEIKE